jgi:hypothetical protein
MGLWVRVRGLAVRQLGPRDGVVLGSCVASVRDGGQRRGADRFLDRRRGNRRVEAIRFAPTFRVGPGERPRSHQGGRGRQGAVRDRPVCRRALPLEGGRLSSPLSRTRSSAASSSRAIKRVKTSSSLRKSSRKPRGALSRPTVQSGRAAHRRESIAARAVYDVRVEPKIIERPNNRVDSGVRDQRRRQDDGQGHRFRRQSRLFERGGCAT